MLPLTIALPLALLPFVTLLATLRHLAVSTS
ncbi:MAG: hypothetical protein QOF27_422 [Gaiellaceae bacterium]|jgi:hypothetical protein|nr:hypothetical protein [Gaiellaceae bacterium]